jgi:hypothetical protein
MRTSAGRAEVAVVLGLLSLAPRVAAADCLTVQRLGAADYWETELVLGVEEERDLDGRRLGHLAGQPGACFEVPLRGLDADEARASGYLAGLSSFVGSMPDDPAHWKDVPESVTYLRKAARVTGVSFLPAAPAPADVEAGARRFQEYMRGALHRLTWSSAFGTLVVNGDAGPEDVSQSEEIDAVTYWTYEALGVTSQVRDGPVDRRGRYRLRVKQGSFRVPLAELEDRKVRLTGYLEAVELLVLRLSDPSALSETDRRAMVARLEQLTGERLATPQAWLPWWMRNRDGLILSGDGQRLITESR